MEICDWELMKNGAGDVISRQFVLFGKSACMDRMVGFLTDMGLGRQLLGVCDLVEKFRGGVFYNYRVISPDELKSLSPDILVIVTGNNANECYRFLLDRQIPQTQVCSGQSFCLAVHYDAMGEKASAYLTADFICEYKRKYQIWLNTYRIREAGDANSLLQLSLDSIMRMPVTLLLLGMPKTGNITLRKSFEHIDNAHFARHFIWDDRFFDLKALHDILKSFPQHEIRIITGVRQPIERLISCLWQFIYLPVLHGDQCPPLVLDGANSAGLNPDQVKKYIAHLVNDDEEWLNQQIKEAFGIDLFVHPFDAKKGYTVVREKNVSVFCYRLDHLSQLEKEIGEFAQVPGFVLTNENTGESKPYGVAYDEYMKEVTVTKEYLDEILNGKIMQHFYTEKERDDYRKNWEKTR